MTINKIVVGSEEWCALPQLNIPAIKVRVDSGAKTSALYKRQIENSDFSTPFKSINGSTK